MVGRVVEEAVVGAVAWCDQLLPVVTSCCQVVGAVADVLVRPEHTRPLADESHSPGVQGALQAGTRRLQVRTHQLRDRAQGLLPSELLLLPLRLVAAAAPVLGHVVVADVGGVAEIGRLVQGGASTQLVGLG